MLIYPYDFKVLAFRFHLGTIEFKNQQDNEKTFVYTTL